MVIRRIREHVATHNWFAVAIWPETDRRLMARIDSHSIPQRFRIAFPRPQ